MTSRRKRNWSKTIEESGLRARLYTRPGGATVYFSLVLDGKKIQKSTGLKDRKQAEQYAREVVQIISEDRRTGRSANVTLGALLRLYFKHRAPYLSEQWRQASNTRRGLFEQAWGTGKPVADIGQADVDLYVDMRRAGKLKPETTNRADGVRDGTIEADLRWLSTVFRWGRGYKSNGRALVAANPLEGIERPKERNVRRPIASHQRFMATLEYVDQVDPMGRLRCMLKVARYTGHRENAICQLRASDFLRTPAHVARALAELGQDESRAMYFPHGGIRWRAESDKQGRDTIVPVGPDVRESLLRYLEQNSRVGEAYLFPSPHSPEEPLRKDVAGRWLMKAEKLARLPKLAGGRWHPYRRLWATERKHLPSQDVAAAGGWNDTQALTLIYQKSDPKTVLQVVQLSG